MTSAVVQAEIQPAPQKVKQLFERFIGVSEIVDISEETLRLRDAY